MAYSNGEILIEKDIKLPEYEHHCKYPFANMAIGDSFEVTLPKRDRYGNWNSSSAATRIRGAFNYWMKAMNIRWDSIQITIRTNRNDENTVRVWRIK